MSDLSDLLRLCAILRGRPARNAYDWQAADAIEALRAENERLRKAPRAIATLKRGGAASEQHWKGNQNDRLRHLSNGTPLAIR